MSESVWGTISDTSPLRVTIDGDAAELPFTPESLVDPTLFEVGDRVRCEFSSRRLLILGVGGGKMRLADAATTVAGADDKLVVTPAGAKAGFDAWNASDVSRLGLLETRQQGVVPASVVVGSGSASAAADGTVTVSGASSLSLNGVFNNSGMGKYVVDFDITMSANASLLFRLRASGTDSTTGYGRHANYWNGSFADTTGMASNGDGAASALLLGYVLGSASRNVGQVRLSGPALSAGTFMEAHFVSFGGSWLWANDTGLHSSTSAFDGLSLIANSGTISGFVKVVRL